jgi:hypothetical protein
MDAGFPNEKTLGGLERRQTPYLARVKNNPALDKLAEPFLRRPPGRRPSEPRTGLYEMTYRAKSWSRERRMVLVVLERADDLFLQHFWLVTNWSAEHVSAETLLEMYRQPRHGRGPLRRADERAGPGIVVQPAPEADPTPATPQRASRTRSTPSRSTRSGCCSTPGRTRRCTSAARWWPSRPARAGASRHLRERVLKVAARVLVHSRRVTFAIAPSAAQLWRALWSQLGRLELAPSG